MPTVDCVLLGSGKSNKGQDFGSLSCSLSADARCLQAGKACNINNNNNNTGLPAFLSFENQHPKSSTLDPECMWVSFSDLDVWLQATCWAQGTPPNGCSAAGQRPFPSPSITCATALRSTSFNTGLVVCDTQKYTAQNITVWEHAGHIN